MIGPRCSPSRRPIRRDLDRARPRWPLGQPPATAGRRERGPLFGHLARERATRAAGLGRRGAGHLPRAARLCLARGLCAAAERADLELRGRARARAGAAAREADLRALLDAMVARFDSAGFAMQGGEASFRADAGAHRGLRDRAQRGRGKVKLSQNRALEDRQTRRPGWRRAMTPAAPSPR